MSMEKSLAIVLKVVDFSETSAVLTLFTESHGKISGLAKGARRPKSPFFGGIDTLSVSQVMFIPRRPGTLDLLTEAKLHRRFRPCQWSLARLYAGYYLAELLLELTEVHHGLPRLFRQTLQTLDDLQRPETDFRFQPVSAILLRFEMRTLSLLGHGLGLTHCAACDRELFSAADRFNGVAETYATTAAAAYASPGPVPLPAMSSMLAGQPDSAADGNAGHNPGPWHASTNLSPSDAGTNRAPSGPVAEKPGAGTPEAALRPKETSRPDPGNRRNYFSLADTSLVCSRCRTGRGMLLTLSNHAVRALECFQHADDVAWRNLSEWGYHPTLRNLLDRQWQTLLGRPLRLQSAIGQLVAKERKRARPSQGEK